MSDESVAYDGGHALVDALIAQGIDHIFCVPGESYLAALNALYDRSDKVTLITCRHEAAAANMADAYGKLTGRPAVCFVTRGPGATHASVGVHTAYQDSTPMLVLIGQVATDQADREAFQEVDFRQMFAPLTKWVGQVERADRMAEYVGHAVSTAMAGRMGPVVLALPEDVLSAPAPKQASKAHPAVRAYPDPDMLETMAGMIGRSKKPLMLLGGSGWHPDAIENVARFATENAIATAASFRCQDLMDNRLGCYVGDFGFGPNPKLVTYLKQSDLIIAFGARLGEVTTNGYHHLAPPVPEQPLIHIHSGAEELGRVYQADLRIHSAPGPLARALADVSLDGTSARAGWVQNARDDYLAWTTPVANAGDVQLAEIYRHMDHVLPDNAIITNGAGNYAAWLHRFYRYRSFRTQLAPTNGSMGYGVPAAIAAAITEPERTIICCAGDGCFMMSAAELATVAHYKLKIIFLVFNNGMYGTIRMHQERAYPERVIGTGLTNPDFVALAQSFGLAGAKVTKTEEFAPALNNALHSDQATLIEVMVDPNAISPTTTIDALRHRS